MQSHSDEFLEAIELREVGKYKEAQERLGRILQLDPKNAEALSLLAHVLMLDKKEAEAESALTAAASINSKLPSIYRNQARLLLNQSKNAKALEKAQLGYQRTPEDLESLLVLAACLGANKRDLEALSIVEKLLRAKPDYAEVYATRMFIRLRAQDIVGAVKDAEMTVSLKPHLTPIWFLLGSLHHQNNNLSEAIRALRNAHKNEPKNVTLLIHLGEFLRQDNRVSDAINVLEKATILAPKDASAWTNLGIAFQQEQKITNAKLAYERTLALQPKSAAVLNNLGIIEKDAKNWESALRYFEKSLEIDPHHAEAHSNVGNILQELSKFRDAETSYKQAIALKPDYAEAHHNLGITLQKLGKLEEAVTSCKQAIALKPDYAEAHSNLGNTLQELGRLDEAETSYKQAIALKPDYAEAHSNLGKTLQELGKSDEAEANYKQAIALKPDFAEAHSMLTSMKKFDAQDEQYLKMRELYLDTNISEEQRCHINFGLAKACEDLKDFEQAFVHYSKGNALRKKLLNYDINQDVELFRQIIFNYPRIEQNSLTPGRLSKNLMPVFIVGMPRSGTTLAEQIISSHSQVTGAGELSYATQFGAAIATGFSEANESALLDFRHKYLAKLQNISDGKLIVTDKMPQNFRYIGLLCAAFPEAKIIHVKRNPAAVCWANYKQYFASKSIGYCYAIDDVIGYHKLYKNLMKFWINSLSNRLYSLDYERLTLNQESETRQLIDYLDLDWDDKCLSPQKNTRSVATASNLQVREKVYQGSSEQWKKYKPFLNGAFDHLLA